MAVRDEGGTSRWSQLEPIAEAAAAERVLRDLGVTNGAGTGWALPSLGAVAVVQAILPGATIRTSSEAGTLRIYVTGGTLIGDHEDLAHRAILVATGAAIRICENCGRPGEYRKNDYFRVVCDLCDYLRTHPYVDVPFAPRLPLTQETRRAVAQLATHRSFVSIPDGWASIAVGAIQAVEDTHPPSNYALSDRGDHLSITVANTPNGFRPRKTIPEITQEASARTCKWCGRAGSQRADANGEPTCACDGCAWVRQHPWTVTRVGPDQVSPTQEESDV